MIVTPFTVACTDREGERLHGLTRILEEERGVANYFC